MKNTLAHCVDALDGEQIGLLTSCLMGPKTGSVAKGICCYWILDIFYSLVAATGLNGAWSEKEHTSWANIPAKTSFMQPSVIWGLLGFQQFAAIRQYPYHSTLCMILRKLHS